MRAVHLLILSGLFISCCGCSFLEASGEAAGVVGKAGWTAAKAVGGVVYTGTSMAGQTANQTNKNLMRESSRHSSSSVTMADGRLVVPLEREGTSFFVRVTLNGTVPARLLLDTGASAMQVSRAMSRKLKVKTSNSQVIPVMLAGGGYVRGHAVDITEVAVGSAKVHHVKAIVLEHDNLKLADGLLGMSFLENFIFSMDTKKGELILEKRK